MRDMLILIEADSSACRSMARKLRSEELFCRILSAAATGEDVLRQDPRGILLAGGDTGEPAEIPCLESLLATGLPVLAMGDAALSLGLHLGGSLGEKAAEPGLFPVRFESAEDLFAGVSANDRYLPACRCINLSAACHPIAETEGGVLGFRAAGKSVYGLAFLPETNDPDGLQLLTNFSRNICGCTPWWNRQVFLDRAMEDIRSACPGETEALCAISGGVDSGVCAVLGNQAIGHRLHCLFIDTGLLRKGESEEVLSLYRDKMGLNVQCVDAREEILHALEGVSNSRAKERIIHEMLQEILRREIQGMPGVKVMLQGTNYSDTLDAPADAPADGLTVIEPVRDLFKDEIRRVGEDLFLPANAINRQPFPGSGLALRILGEVTLERLQTLRAVDAIFCDALQQAGLTKRLWQYFAVLCPMPGDAQGAVICLRSVQSASDSGQAYAARLPYDVVEAVVEKAMEQRPEVRRVVYDLTPSRSYTGVEWQ